MKKAYKFTKRRLPRHLNAGSIYFVTVMLHGALPKAVIEKLKAEYEEKVYLLQLTQPKDLKLRMAILQQEHLKKYDQYLDQALYGPTYLAQAEIAEIVKEQFHRFEDEFYELLAYTIMPNHFHLLIDTSVQLETGEADPEFVQMGYKDLSDIMKRIKGASARYANQALNRSGTFWLHEFFDRIVRSEKGEQFCVNYILNNPVKARMVKRWEDFPHTYLKTS